MLRILFFLVSGIRFILAFVEMELHEEDNSFEFAGAVGFFDAPQSSPRQQRARSVSDSGAMGFFDVLDTVSEIAIGYRQAAFVFNGSSSDAPLDRDELASVLNNNSSSLGKLVVRNNQLSSTDFQVLSGSLLRLHHLCIMDFSGNQLGVSGLITLLDCCRGNVGLSELHLASIGLNDRVADDYDCVCRTLDDFPVLQVLDLSGNGLGPEVIRAIGLSASEHPCLQILRLERNNVSVTTAVGILQYLSGNITLHTLILGEESKPSSRAITMKSLLKRTFRHEKDALADALVSNIALRTLQVDSISTHDMSKVRAILLQNQNIWSLREGGNLSRADLSHRGLTTVHSYVFTLTHIVELDLSGNSLDALPESVTSLKNLQWLSLENNMIPSTALPFHLCNLRKLRILLISGNPFCSELPRNVAVDSCPALLQYFRDILKVNDMESQVAVLCTSLDEKTGEIAKELERRSRLARRANSDPRNAMVRLRVIGNLASSALVGKFGFVSQSPRKSRRSSMTIPKNSTDNKRSSNRSALSPEQARKSLTNSDKDINSLGSTIWGVVRECSSIQFPVFSPFHKIIVISVSLTSPDWESRVREMISLTGSNNSDTNNAFVILVINGVSSITLDARKGLMHSVSRRLRRYGVRDVIPISHDSEFQLVCDAVNIAILTLVEIVGTHVPRSYSSLFASFQSEPTHAPLQPLARFNSHTQISALQWAQVAGIASQPIGGFICTSLEWAITCFECIADTDVSVFQADDYQALFPSESFRFESRNFALMFLEHCKVIVRIGWEHEQWIVNRRLATAFPGQMQLRTLPAAPVGAILCVRLFRINSALEMSVSSIVRKLFLQAIGVLTDISAVSMDGFCGSLEVKDISYLVQVAIERTSSLTVVVSTHCDVSGQVVHMVTTAIERALEEDMLDFSRLFQAADGSELDLDRLVTELLNSTSRQALDMTLSSSIGRHLPLLPDILLLDAARVFWDELKVEHTIGRGSFGEISLATFRNQKKVAVKKITRQQDSQGSPFSIQRESLREIWVLSLLKHPNIVALVGACFSPLAICMEFLELGSLRGFLDSHTILPWPIRCSLLLDMAGGMEYAHSLHPPLVHSDLKSPNVLLSLLNGVLVAKIADLGLASFTSMNAVTMVDNPLWAAPEMIKHAVCSPSVDIYSFGIIMWELCSGLLPFAIELQQLGGFLAKLSEEILNGRRPPLTQVDSSVPEDALQLMKECWAHDSAQRPGFRSIVGRLLRQSSSIRNATSPQGIRPYLTTPIPSETKAIALVGDWIVALTTDGRLWVFESVTMKFLQTLRWKLGERIRTASAVSLGTEAYFIFGGDSIFILSETMAARQVQSNLSFLDVMCVVGTSLWVAGRNEGGIAMQIWNENSWNGGAWKMDCRAQIATMSVVKHETWCVYHEKDGSAIATIPITVTFLCCCCCNH
jgi:Leucine-rich repeat (LRR) protein